MNLTTTLAHDEMGNPHYLISVIEDINKRKELEEYLNQQRTAFSEMIKRQGGRLWVESEDGIHWLSTIPSRLFTYYLDLFTKFPHFPQITCG